MTIKSMNDLFLHTLKDIYYAEKQIYKNLPKTAKFSSAVKMFALAIGNKELSIPWISKAGYAPAILVNSTPRATSASADERKTSSSRQRD